MAPTRAASTTYWVTISSWIMPLPMVLATAVPRKKAATKLKNAAQITASLGESTRVETTVAMLLAASWKPLRKSKVSATRMVMTSSSIPSLMGWRSGEKVADGKGASCALQDDGFEHVGGVFGLIGRNLQGLVELLNFDELDGIFLMFEKVGDGLAGDAVGLVLEGVNFDTVFEDALMFFQLGDGFPQLLGLADDDLGELGGIGRHLLNVVHDQAVAGGIDEIEHVIEGGGEAVHVLAVERSDEGLVEPGQNGVGQLVGGVFVLLDPGNARRDVAIILQQLGEDAGALGDLRGKVGKHVEELVITGYQADHQAPILRFTTANGNRQEPTSKLFTISSGSGDGQ